MTVLSEDQINELSIKSYLTDPLPVFVSMSRGALHHFANAVADAAVAADRAGRGEAVAETMLWNEGGSGEFTEVRWFGDVPPSGTKLYTHPPHTDAKPEMVVPDGWMKDVEKVQQLQCHLESIGWHPDEDGNPVCADQAAAMSADVIKLVLLPLIASNPKSS